MRRLLFSLLLGGTLACSSPPSHLQTAADHKRALEFCLQQALQAVAEGRKGRHQIQAEYDACADAADAAYGRRP